MPEPIIVVDHLSKLYELGTIGGRTLQESLQRRWYRLRGKELLLDKVGAKPEMIGPDHPQAGPRPNTMWALKDVSFSVEEGEVLGIIGRNGAGKSTILKILSRITEPTSGRAIVGGRVASLLEVGTGFHPELTGRENVYLSGAVLGMKKAEIARKFDAIVAFSGVDKYIDTPVKRYSSGMYVRLAFAVAAHLDPEILIVDEVLAVGDAEFQRKCLGKMGDVAGEGRTILFVSHNMSAIANLCNRTVILTSGRMSFMGVTDQAIEEYQNAVNVCGTIDLADRNDREGDGAIRFTRVSLLDSVDHPVDVAVSGKPLRIVLEFDAHKQLSMVDFAVAFRTNLGDRLFVCAASHSGSRFEITPGHGRVTCEIESLPLGSGVYMLHLSAGRGSFNHDWIPQAHRLQVQTIDYFGTGSDVSVGHSPFLVKSDWCRD